MVRKDELEFAKIFAATCEVYEKPVSKTLTTIYFDSLKHFPIDRVKEAFNHHVKTSRFFPKPSDLIELIEGAKEEKALVAWREFRETIRHHGANNSIVFEDPKISWIIESYGGWIRVCGMESKELDFMRLGFLKAYNSLRDDVPQKKLIGLDEWENGRCGFNAFIPKPICISHDKIGKLIEDNEFGDIGSVAGSPE